MQCQLYGLCSRAGGSQIFHDWVPIWGASTWLRVAQENPWQLILHFPELWFHLFADKAAHFICPPRSDKVRVGPFWLKIPFLLSHTFFFYPFHFHAKPPLILPTYASSISTDNRTLRHLFTSCHSIHVLLRQFAKQYKHSKATHHLKA